MGGNTLFLVSPLQGVWQGWGNEATVASRRGGRPPVPPPFAARQGLGGLAAAGVSWGGDRKGSIVSLAMAEHGGAGAADHHGL